MSAFTLGLNNVTYGDIEVWFIRFYSDEKNSTWVLKKYKYHY
jgi:hypothetical protein